MRQPFRIGMLLLPEYNGMGAQGFLDPFRAANYVRGEGLYDWNFLGFGSATIKASSGLTVQAESLLEDSQGYLDMLVVNASFAPERYQQADLRNRLRQLARGGCLMVGIDTGAFVLAYAGLLQGYHACVHYEHVESFAELFPRSTVARRLFVIDGNRMTAAGGVASIDLALEVIRGQHGMDLANAAARYVLHDRLRSSEDDQLASTHEPVGYTVPAAIRDALLLMEKNLEEPLSIPDIAGHLDLSVRQLERLFRRYTGEAPIAYYANVRLDRARSLITQTSMTLLEVASACGFNTVDHMSRAYKRRFRITPSRDRTEGRIPFQFRSFPRHAGIQKTVAKPD